MGRGKRRAGEGRRGRLVIGASGYQYPHWRDVFYPRTLPVREWFGFYARHFASVELNVTFYGLPAADRFDAWREAAPSGFCFALKFSRYGSHLKRLREPEQTIETFLERARLLGDRLGPILVQLPPRWRADPARLDAFLRAAPKSCRWAVELRDPSWLCDEVYEVLRRHRAALCIHDMLEDHPRLHTADWTYLRFHGRDVHGHQYAGSYTPQALYAHARRIDGWLREGRDVYAYFNNDADAWAVENAAALRRYAERRARR